MTVNNPDRKIRIDKDFRWVERVSTLMDTKFNLGGFRFGLDPILGLFPIVGQGISLATALLLVLLMYRHGVSSKAACKMLINVMIDALVGAIPILGNAFDFVFKANKRNVKILRQYYYEDKHQGSAAGILRILFASLLLLCILLFYVLWLLGEWIISLF